MWLQLCGYSLKKIRYTWWDSSPDLYKLIKHNSEWNWTFCSRDGSCWNKCWSVQNCLKCSNDEQVHVIYIFNLQIHRHFCLKGMCLRFSRHRNYSILFVKNSACMMISIHLALCRRGLWNNTFIKYVYMYIVFFTLLDENVNQDLHHLHIHESGKDLNGKIKLKVPTWMS